ncbi:MAG: threonine--tRNA ligase [Patescibacteria group bacterium]
MNDLDNIRHSLAHLLAAAVLKKFPKAKLGIGPTIENGFYYDFLLPRNLTPEDLKEFEKTIKWLITQNLPFSGKKVTPATAKKTFEDQLFKLDLIKEFTKDKKPLSIYYTGKEFFDLCRGGHVKNTSEINPDAFKLTHIAGAYWRGSEKNPQLQRIYGLAFTTKKELEEYLKMQEEAKKRDHREIGKKQKLFIFDDLIGSGLPLWLPNGTIIKNEIEKFAVEMEEKYGYRRVATPHIAKQKLFETSGHLPYYADSMFPPMKLDDGNYYLKAMNCPLHHLIYKSEPRSYRDLPLRFAEYGTVYRNELSGTLAGLLRVRMLSMNDAHIYCRADQIEEEFKKVMELTIQYFGVFGLKNYSFRLSLWDPKNKKKYINEPKNWKMAEDILRNVLKNLGVKFTEVKNEAAFYGPKVDIQYKSVGGREETMSTIQLDFAAKKRFDLIYHDKDGKENDEVFVIHRAPLSTHERFIAYLIEHYAGEWPTWLAPSQVKILPVSEKFSSYGEKVLSELKQNSIRAEISEANETLGKRIRETEIEKVPYTLVVGEREMKDENVNVRKRGKKETETISLQSFIAKIAAEIHERK